MQLENIFQSRMLFVLGFYLYLITLSPRLHYIVDDRGKNTNRTLVE